jgi:hypothetical protein
MPPGQSIPFDGFQPFDDARHTFDGRYVGPIGGAEADLAILYQMGPAGFASSATVTAASVATPFEIPVLLDTADEFSFDVAARTTHTVRYQSGPRLAAGDVLDIEGVEYLVVGVPQRINRAETRAGLVLQP